MKLRNQLSWKLEGTQGFPSGSVVENPPPNTGDASLLVGQEDPLEKEMVTHFNMLAWEILWTEEPGGLQFIGLLRHDLTT